MFFLPYLEGSVMNSVVYSDAVWQNHAFPLLKHWKRILLMRFGFFC